MSDTTNAPNLTDIDSDRFTIASGTLKAGSISFQIRNIASLQIEGAEDPELGTKLGSAFLAGIVAWAALGFTISGLLGFIAFIVVGSVLLVRNWRTFYQLKILTNAASSFRLLSEKRDWLIKVKSALEESMERRDDRVTFNIDRISHNIERVEQNTTSITNTNSPGANTAVNVSGTVTQSSDIRIQGLQDIAELSKLFQAHASAQAAPVLKELEFIRAYLAGGGSSKSDAQEAWKRVVEKIGLVAGAGNSVWALVARLAELLK